MANSPARSDVDVGSVIADTYIIEALIGEGGMGSVYLASHNRLPGKRVAIKMLHVELNNDEVLARFRREATIATQLDHPNIVRVDDFNVHENGTPYLILEYLEGESLAQRLTHGPMPLDQVMAIVRMVGSAIAAAHQLGYVHRDLKPQNIFLIPTEVDGKLVDAAKVLDFGISKMRNSTTVKTQENTLLGTPQYMAPEQATGQHANVDERTDVFALGAIVYEMLTGKPAFSGESIPEVVFKVVYEPPVVPLATAAPDVPATIVAAVERAMQKAQDDRFPTVNAFVETLTGRPIVQRSAMISLSPDRPKPTTSTTGKRDSQAAYASTVDSGSVAKSVAHVSPHAKTLASHSGEERSPSAPPARPRALLFAIALACVLGGGAAIFFATRGGEEPAPRVAIVEDAALPAVAIDAIPIDAAVSVDAPPPPDAAIAKAVDAAVKVTTKTPAVNRNEGDPAAWEFLDKANAAFKAGNLDLAKLHCNSVVDSSATASPVQRSLALLLRGTIHCKRQQIGGAQADLRQIPIASYKATLIARCKAANQPLQ